MRIGFIVQRFGEGVEGGAEKHCSLLAGRLQATDDVEILTSTALVAGKWHVNHFQTGPDTHDGLPVRRFATRTSRGPFSAWYALHTLQNRLLRPTLAKQWQWIESQGPVCPDLLRYLEDHRDEYDAFVFFTYLYHPTAAGLLRVAGKSVLVPTAHDEPPLRFEAFRPLFLAPRVILYNTEEERDLVVRRFRNEHVPSIIAGLGIEPPPPGDAAPAGEDIVYLGRIARNKLFDLVPFFLRYVERRPTARLVLVGKEYERVPDHPRIVKTGFVSEEEKWRRIRGARVFVMPSAFESLSIVLLEAWSAGVPALVNGRCEVLAGHVRRCGGGYAYERYDEFSGALDALLDSPEQAARMGEAGMAYVAERYRWETILPRIREAIRYAAGHSGWHAGPEEPR